MINSLLITYAVDKVERITKFFKTNLPQQRGAVYGIPPIESEDSPLCGLQQDKEDQIYKTRRNK